MSTEPAYWMRPAAALYEMSSDGAMAEPHTIFVRESMATFGRTDVHDLIVVSGPLWMPAVRAQATHLAAQQGARVLTIAVLQLPKSAAGAVANDEHVQELTSVFDSVFIVAHTECGDLIRRLIHAIMTPGEPNQAIGCDWNDVCHIVAGSADEGVAGYGFGRAAGAGRATSAALAALEQVGGQGFALNKARGVCIAITAARANLLGKEVKEVMTHVRTRVDPSVTIAQCIDFDDAMGDAAMEVDIFAFGTSALGLLISPGAIASRGADTPQRHADPLYEDARTLVLRARRASISLVQRNLGIGYSHACRLLDAMEGDILSPVDDNGVRTLVIDSSTEPLAEDR